MPNAATVPAVAASLFLLPALTAQSPPEGSPATTPIAALDKPYVGPSAPPGTFTSYGSACLGSARVPGGPIVPNAYATKWGESANYYPHGRGNIQYQQVFLGSEIGTVVMNGLAFRLDDGYGGPAATMPIKLTVGRTTLDPATIATTQPFASNFNSGTPQVVFNSNWSFPAHTPPNTDLTKFVPVIPFSAPVVFTGNPNLLVEIVNTASADVTHFFDAAITGANTTRIWATPIAATPTGMSRNYGLVMQLRSASGNTVAPLLGAVGVPEINKTFQITLAQALPNTGAGLILGASRTNWGAFTLPLALAPFGAPGCSLLASMDSIGAFSVDGNGTTSVPVAVPNLQALIGVHFYCQWAVLDANANVMKLAWSNAADAGIGG